MRRPPLNAKVTASTAAGLLREAIDLWRGDFLEDLDIDRVGGPDVVPPEESLIDIVCDLAALELAEGNHRWVRDRVRPLLRRHPENNRLAALLMRALLADGDRIGALRVYHDAVGELGQFGIAAPADLRELARLARSEGRRNTLPRRPNVFTDRAEPLARVAELAEQGAARLVWVSGPPGVGKTTFAVEAAHRMSSSFPGGLLFVPLNGFTLNVDPLTSADALAILLRDLGVPEERIPKATNERAVLYQERLAGSRTLVVLDNAASDEHVRELLPDAPGCFAIVTSRRVSDLLDGGTQIRLSPFSVPDGAAQFRTLVDPRRLSGAAAEIDRIVTGCGGLPLHIRLVAAQFSRHETWPIAHLAALLEERVPWRADADFADVSAILVSYRHLDDDQRMMFRLCGLVPGADLDLARGRCPGRLHGVARTSPARRSALGRDAGGTGSGALLHAGSAEGVRPLGASGGRRARRRHYGRARSPLRLPSRQHARRGRDRLSVRQRPVARRGSIQRPGEDVRRPRRGARLARGRARQPGDDHRVRRHARPTGSHLATRRTAVEVPLHDRAAPGLAGDAVRRA